MSFLKKIFGQKFMDEKPLNRIKLSEDNISMFPKFGTLLEKGKVKFDSLGRLRYLHGAPVGDMILTRVNKDGRAIYKESADEWFDPESEKAKNFVWH